MTDFDATKVSSSIDFGSGSVIARNSRCLRHAKLASNCDICFNQCPINALSDKGGRIVAAESCVKCGLCIELCPVGAIAVTRASSNDIFLRLMGATLRDQQLIIGCAQAAASLPDNLRSKLFEVPCLATIGAELWFYALNETGISASSSISVFLPTTICAQCLVNRNANAENIYSDAISQAEVWSGRFVDILSKQEELAATDRKNLLDNLSNPEQGDRREVLESIMDNFKQSWNHAGEALEQSNQGNRDNPRLRQIIQQRQRNMNLSGIDLISGNFGGTVTDDTDINGGFAARLSANSNQTNCNSAKKLEPKRKALIAAMLDVPETAKQVSILLSTTDYSKCSGCKKCVDACPLDARRIVRGNSAILFSDLSPQTGPAATQVAFVDPLICTGCSACIQHCPEDACAYKTISGAELVKLCKPHA